MGGTFQGVFQVYKEHVPEAKQSSDHSETSGQKNPPERADIFCNTKKVPTPSKTYAGDRACGHVVCAMPRDTGEHSYAGVQTSLGQTMSVMSAADAQGPVSLCASLGSSRGSARLK